MKDVKITSTRITSNIVQMVEKTASNGSKNWIKTQKFDEDKYDLAVDLAGMSEGGRRDFWSKNYVEIEVNLEAQETEEGKTEISRLILMLDRLSPGFFYHAQNVFINLLFPEGDTVYLPLKALTKDDPTALQILDLSTVAALLPLMEKLKNLRTTQHFVVTIRDPSWTDETLSYSMLNHAVPFADLPFQWRLDWLALWFRKPERVSRASMKYVEDQHKKTVQERKEKKNSES